MAAAAGAREWAMLCRRGELAATQARLKSGVLEDAQPPNRGGWPAAYPVACTIIGPALAALNMENGPESALRPVASAAAQGASRFVVHVELHRVGVGFEAVEFFLLEVDVGVDEIVAHHAALH